MANAITGRIHRITPEQTITGKSGKTFTKRTLILDAARYDTHTGEKKYDNYPSVEFWGDGMKILDNFKEGDAVTVSYDINGREFEDPETHEIRYFNTIRGFKIERYGDARSESRPQAPSEPSASTLRTALTHGEDAPQAQPQPQGGFFPPDVAVNGLPF